MSARAAAFTMPEQVLRLVMMHNGNAAAHAWLLPGAGPEHWLAALADVDPARLHAARLLVLPRSRADHAAAGALLIGADDLPPHPRRHAWQARAGRVFLPADARIEPPLDDDELLRLLVHDLLVLHPGIGAVGIDSDQAMPYAALFAPPASSGPAFDRARPAPPAPHIAGLAGIAPGDADAVVSGGGDDIGTLDPKALAPPGTGIAGAAGHALKGLGKAGAAIARGLSGMLGGMSGGNQGTGAGAGGGGGGLGGALGRMASWSSQAFNAAAERLLPGRMAAIERLLDLLDSDPERGLRHALPLEGTGGASRGIARPGAQLGTHNLDFNLGRLGGGGPADVWDLPFAIRQRLTARYRELAKQELAAGNHRRAAYIFAHLLGDFTAAARALEDGHHHREAAVLWRERLNRPQEAARCLERGGLWDEAIAIHEELGNHRAAGDCHQRLGRIEQARACWRRAAEALIEHDPLGAAALFENPLDEPDEALAVLAGTWPRHAQAGRCLDERFNLLGRLGRHVQATALVGALTTAEDHPAVVVETFTRLVAGYPDPGLRLHAADCGRVLVGARLAKGDNGAALLRLLGRLDPDDRLLARDALAYVPATIRLPAPPPSAPLILDPDYRWSAAAVVDGGMLAAGVMDHSRGPRLTVARLAWTGTAQYVRWEGFVPATEAASLTPVRLLVQGARVHVCSPHRLFLQHDLPVADGLPGRMQFADFAANDGLITTGGARPLAVAASFAGMSRVAATAALIGQGESLMLMAQGAGGTRVVALPLAATGPFALAMLDGVVAVIADGCLLGMAWPPDASWNQALVTPDESGVDASFQGIPGLRLAMLDQPMLDYAVSPDGATIAISHPDGVSVHRPAPNGWLRVKCGQGQTRPAIGFSRDGVLVVADSRELRRYRCAPPKVEVFETRRWEPVSAPAAIVAHARQSQVAVLLSGGGVIVV